MPARSRHLLGPAQSEPHVTRGKAGSEGLERRAVAQLGQRGLTHDHPAVRLTEHLGDGAVELADLQWLNPYRIS